MSPARTRSPSASGDQPDSPGSGHLHRHARRPARAKRRHARRVIGVPVRHQHARQRPAAERPRDRVEMRRVADARHRSASAPRRRAARCCCPGRSAGSGYRRNTTRDGPVDSRTASTSSGGFAVEACPHVNVTPSKTVPQPREHKVAAVEAADRVVAGAEKRRRPTLRRRRCRAPSRRAGRARTPSRRRD